MRNQSITILKILFFSAFLFTSLTKGQSEIKRINLPNGWAVTPAGKSLPLGDLPLQMAVSSSGKYIAVTNNGQSDQSIQLIDGKRFTILDEKEIAKAWFGLVFSEDEKSLYASGGNDNWILRYAIKKNKLQIQDTLKLGEKWPEKISPAGLALDDRKNILYVVTKENNSLYLLDTKT
ncbi:MAG: hypothetical protein WC557_07315, partial [Ignavibacteriaceae bacterium]